MSVQAITWALGFDVASATEKAILLVLANYADGEGVCWPGQDSIAAQAACSDRTVRAVLTSFEARGVISRTHRQRRDGSRSSDEIRLTAFAEPNRKHLPEGQPEKVSARPTGNLRQSNRKSASIQPEAASGLTTFEPSGEPLEEPSVSLAAPRARPEDAVSEWNDLAKRLGLPAARTVDKTRRAAIRARLAEGGMTAWREALEAVERSPHCRGENDRGWRADIDFVCQPKSWRRLLEGFYGPKPDAQAGSVPSDAPIFAGPAELREAVVTSHGEPYARTYLDPCRWDGPNRALIPANDFAGARLRSDLAALSERWRFSIAPADTLPAPTQDKAA